MSQILNPQIFYLDVDYIIDRTFATDVPEDFHITFDKNNINNFGDYNIFYLTLVSYNIVRDQSYVPPVNKAPIYLWSDLKRGCSSEMICLLNFDVSDGAQSNTLILESNPEKQLVNFRLYLNKRPKDTTQPWPKPDASEKIINVLLRFKLEVFRK